MAPLVSVIIPAHNAGPFLGGALASVLRQTMADWEAIIVENGSTDGTLDVAREYAARDGRIRVYQVPAAGHPGPPRNFGMERARGRYIALLDADDIWVAEKLQWQLEAISAINEPGICYGFVEEFMDGTGEVVATGWDAAPPPAEHRAQYARNLVRRQIPSTPTMLFERELYERLGGFSDEEDLKVGEDWDFTNRYLWERPLICIPRVVARVRVVENSATSKMPDSWRYRFRVLERAEERGQLPAELRGAAWSAAWLVRGENGLRDGAAGWRMAFTRAMLLDPGNVRRWLGLLGWFLPRPVMEWLYNALRGNRGDAQRRTFKNRDSARR